MGPGSFVAHSAANGRGAAVPRGPPRERNRDRDGCHSRDRRLDARGRPPFPCRDIGRTRRRGHRKAPASKRTNVRARPHTRVRSRATRPGHSHSHQVTTARKCWVDSPKKENPRPADAQIVCPLGPVMRAPIGMYEGVGPCQGCVGARGRCGCCRVRLLVCRGGVPIKGLVWARVWCGQARLPRHVFALRFAHDGIGGHGQGGLNQLSDRNADARVMPIVELASWSCPSLTRRSRPVRGNGSRRRAGRSS